MRSETPRRCSACPSRVGDPEDQHVLGEPALVARLDARDPKRVAFLARERVAAIAGADAPDGVRLREVADEARSGDRSPRLWMPRTNVPSTGRAAQARLAHARHERRLSTTYGLSVSSTPTRLYGDPGGPMRYGTTYIVRPRMARRRAARPCAAPPRAHPVVRGAGVAFLFEQMKVRCSVRATSLGRSGRESCAGTARSPAGERSATDHLGLQTAGLRLGAIAPVDRLRLVCSATVGSTERSLLNNFVHSLPPTLWWGWLRGPRIHSQRSVGICRTVQCGEPSDLSGPSLHVRTPEWELSNARGGVSDCGVVRS